mmetsp:Transcript_42602/g.76524  ORF Transcript_42602/g.76524 Transcript_42602/m.76524 type:complete len:220 (-) Transcript_42602:489-1148(-)
MGLVGRRDDRFAVGGECYAGHRVRRRAVLHPWHGMPGTQRPQTDGAVLAAGGHPLAVGAEAHLHYALGVPTEGHSAGPCAPIPHLDRVVAATCRQPRVVGGEGHGGGLRLIDPLQLDEALPPVITPVHVHSAADRQRHGKHHPVGGEGKGAALPHWQLFHGQPSPHVLHHDCSPVRSGEPRARQLQTHHCRVQLQRLVRLLLPRCGGVQGYSPHLVPNG